MVMVRVTGSSNDLHASDARYHKDCLSRFFSHRKAPGESNGKHDEEEETLQSTCLMQITTEMRADRTKIWDSVGMQERFTELVGSSIKRANLLKMLSLSVDDIGILSAPGYSKVVMFRDNARAALMVKRDDAEVDDINDALDMIARVIMKCVKQHTGPLDVSRESGASAGQVEETPGRASLEKLGCRTPPHTATHRRGRSTTIIIRSSSTCMIM